MRDQSESVTRSAWRVSDDTAKELAVEEILIDFRVHIEVAELAHYVVQRSNNKKKKLGNLTSINDFCVF